MVISTVTREQRDILAHSLGIVHYAQESYRNHFHSDPGPDLETLVSAGYMTRRAAGAGWSASHFYYVTPEGERACREALKPTSPLFGWWLPDGARAWHFVDQRRPPARGKHSCPETLCGTWLYRLKVPDLLQGDPARPCQKCAAILASFNRKVREVAYAF